MKIIQKEGVNKPKVLTVDELVAGIGEALEKTNGVISQDRLHSVESHLRGVIRALGYQPTATTVAGLHEQLDACVVATETLQQDVHDLIHVQLTATHSNCQAELGTKVAPALKEVPAAPAKKDELKEPPKGKKAKKDAEAGDASTEGASGGAGASGTLTAWLMAALLSLFLIGSGQKVRALDSFNTTNVIYNGLGLVSYPTNVASTNFTITGYTTNGNVITTNGYYPNQQTGRGVEVRNYTFVGIEVSGVVSNITASQNLTLQLIRAGSDNTPLLGINTNTGAITNSEWETTPQCTITVPLPTSGAGGPVAFDYITNLDESYTKPATHLGIYQITNSATSCSISNFNVRVIKKIIPFAFSGGNF